LGNPKETFRTYANYIRAFAQLAGLPLLALGDRTRIEQLAARIRDNMIVVEPQGEPDLVKARASLVNAWGTEMILNVTMRYAQEDELVGLTNNWAAVQLYYAAYHATQALLVARGYDRPQSHPQTQRMFADLWVNRAASITPWSLGVGFAGVRNGPDREIDSSIHPWSACNRNSCWDLAAKALQTTRDDVVNDGLRRAREEKQRVLRRALEERRVQRQRRNGPGPVALPRLTAEEKDRVRLRVRSYTTLDFLYRLRIKTNYEDAAVFVDGPDSVAQARLVRRDLSYLASSTLLLNEVHIQQAVGQQVVRDWIDTWIAQNHPGGRPIGVARRRPML
jgi:hypothetical protein